MSRRDVRPDIRPDIRPERNELMPPPSKCAKFLYYTWRLCSMVFSHFVMISLVVAYCILGAVTFEKLEAQHEREVKQNVSRLRNNATHYIWNLAREPGVFKEDNWTRDVIDMLKDFEGAILLEMKVRGWDGSESLEHVQWTFTGALFYSIIVITTIGYGHIVPKTQTGKVVTIFYAILGIPLMLLCLSNIGDVMASSFRFLYWRVCCYVCTRPPKRRHRHHTSSRRSVRAGSARGSTRRRRPPMERAHSDTDCRYRDSGYGSARTRRSKQSLAAPRTRSQPPHSRVPAMREYDREDRSPARHDRDRVDRDCDQEDVDFPKISLPLQDLEAALKELEDHQRKASKPEIRSKSLPRPPKTRPDYGHRRDFDDLRNVEEDNKELYQMHDLRDVDYENYRERKARELEDRRPDRDEYCGWRDRDRDRDRDRERDRDRDRERDRDFDPEDDDYDFDAPRPRRVWAERDKRNRGRSEYYEREEYYTEPRGRRARSMYDTGPRWDDEPLDPRRDVESGRNRRLRRLYTVDDSGRPPHRYHSPSPDQDDWSDEVVVPRRVRPSAAWGSKQSEIYPVQPETPKEIKPVPIWLCVFLVASYIVAGTFLFKHWENWEYLDAAYFCFITLTTIGFGDFVPAQGQSFKSDRTVDAVHSIALCSLYLLFGIALLAMSFNLVQEEVRARVSALATRLGIIKPKVQEESDSEY